MPIGAPEAHAASDPGRLCGGPVSPAPALTPDASLAAKTVRVIYVPRGLPLAGQPDSVWNGRDSISWMPTLC